MIEYTPEKAARFTKIISRLANKEEMQFCKLLAESGKPLWPVAVLSALRSIEKQIFND